MPSASEASHGRGKVGRPRLLPGALAGLASIRASAGFIICADLPPNAAASFFIQTSRSDGTITQAGLPSTSVISVLSTRPGGSASGSSSWVWTAKAMRANGGQRGLQVRLDPRDAAAVLDALAAPLVA